MSQTHQTPKARRPRKFASQEHLSAEAVASFVDGELTPAATHRAKVHMVHCTECRGEVDRQRFAADRLRSDSEDIQAPSELVQKLTRIAVSCPAGPGAEDLDREPEGFLGKVDYLYRAVRRTRTR
ncbi:anti-sigma factor family protein [Corynebacterium mendelii]|uniref:Anti-sigma factor n=1 Tax=Corynebacterium mendelii TaxID=2765362 RepID=A0A939IY90_9CORY|nr:anti-sigma factor [Corynebacterium mendelii]MBN9644873.1 anti-sigma factor [Corynebacterium mendelii]